MLNSTELVNASLSNSTTRPATSGQTLLVTLINWFTIFSIFATFSLNGLIVLVYCRLKQLRTPFNAYIVNIAITETLLAVTTMPGNFIRSYFGYWPYDAVACSFYMYFQQILGTAVRWGHLLVTANRIWAVTFPLSYRVAHTNRFSCSLIGVTWVFLHVLSMPLIMRGRLGMGTASAEPTCHNEISHQVWDAVATEIIGFDLPEVFIVLTFPYILWKLHQARFKPAKATASMTVGQSTVPSGVRSSNDSESNGNSAQEPSLSTKKAVKSGSARVGEANKVSAGPVHGGIRQRNRQTSRSHNVVLLYFVIGTIICWTPNHVFFLIVHTSKNYWNNTFNTVQFFLQYTYSWVNPILCYMAIRQLRQAINDFVSCRHFRGTF